MRIALLGRLDQRLDLLSNGQRRQRRLHTDARPALLLAWQHNGALGLARPARALILVLHCFLPLCVLILHTVQRALADRLDRRSCGSPRSALLRIAKIGALADRLDRRSRSASTGP